MVASLRTREVHTQHGSLPTYPVVYTQLCLPMYPGEVYHPVYALPTYHGGYTTLYILPTYHGRYTTLYIHPTYTPWVYHTYVRHPC